MLPEKEAQAAEEAELRSKALESLRSGSYKENGTQEADADAAA